MFLCKQAPNVFTMYRKLSLMAIALMAINSTFAHPGHNIEEEAEEIRTFVKRGQASRSSCEASLARRGHSAASIHRRAELAQQARVKRSLASNGSYRRDFAEYNISHASTATFGDNELQLFADNSTCLLTPETTFGPYYVEGELIRRDVTEDQEGIPLYVDAQYIDVNTCEPVPAVFVEFWYVFGLYIFELSANMTQGIAMRQGSTQGSSILQTVLARTTRATLPRHSSVAFNKLIPTESFNLRASFLDIMLDEQLTSTWSRI